MLNAGPSIRTLAQIMDLLNNRAAYGLTQAELLNAIERLQVLGNDRTAAQNHDGMFCNDRIRNIFLRHLEEKEAELYDEIEYRKLKKKIMQDRLGKTPDTWYNSTQGDMRHGTDYALITDFPAIRDMMNACDLTTEQAAALRRAQNKLDKLHRRDDVTQREIDDALAEACNALLDKTAIESMLLYKRVQDKHDDWVPDKNQPQTTVYAYTEELDALFARARKWAAGYDVIQAAASCVTPQGNSSLSPVRILPTRGIIKHAETPITAAIKAWQLVSFAWKVQPYGVWDIKDSASWETSVMRGKDTDIKELPSSSYRFVYNGELLNAQELGNMLYGYAGTAMGIPEEVLYFAGGVVQNADNYQRDFSKWNIRRDNLYGDTLEDRHFIKKGVDMYREE